MYLWCIDIHSDLGTVNVNYSCDLLSKCIFDVLIFTCWVCLTSTSNVVICFQNVSLMYWYSLYSLKSSSALCCDLLSKCIFDVLIFTLQWLLYHHLLVVICFQNVSLMYWYSLQADNDLGNVRLWFALFICVLFLKVFMLLRAAPWSKCIFDVLIFTSMLAFIFLQMVVICFQNVSLMYWYSLQADNDCRHVRLWFAFKMYLWCIDIHFIELIKI